MRNAFGRALKEVRKKPVQRDSVAVAEVDESENLAESLVEALPKPIDQIFRTLRATISVEGDDLEERTLRTVILVALQVKHLEGQEMPIDCRWADLFQQRRYKKLNQLDVAQEILKAWEIVTGVRFTMKLTPSTKPFQIWACIQHRLIEVTVLLDSVVIAIIARQILESRSVVAVGGNGFLWQAIARSKS